MLNSFRSIGKSFLAKCLLVLLVLSFVVWGVEDMVKSSGRNPEVASVGDINITTQELLRGVQQETENLHRAMGSSFSPDIIKAMNVPQWVLQKLINSALLKQETLALGLIPSDTEVVKRIRVSQEFQDQKGNFDKNIFEARLRNIGMSEKIFVEKLREDIAINALMETFSTNIPVSATAIQTIMEAREEQRNIALYQLPAAAISPITKEDEEKIKNYYNTHSKDFTLPEYRTLSYVTLSNDTVPKQTKVSEEELKALYNERIEEYKRPERRSVEQLLFATQDQAKAAHEMIVAGKTFEQLAKDLPILNKQSVSMGKIERSGLIKDAEEKVFALTKGASTDPIESPFGWHVFHVTAIDAPSTASFEEMRKSLEKQLLMIDSDQSLTKFANKFEDALAGGSTFAEAAKEFGLKVTQVGTVDRQGLSINGAKNAAIPTLDKFLEQAFKAEEKTESPMTTSKGGIMYTVHVDSVTPEKVQPLEVVKPQVISAYQKEEQNKKLQLLATEVSREFSSAPDRAAVIAKYNLQSITSGNVSRDSRALGNITLPADLLNDVFAGKKNQGTSGYFNNKNQYLFAEITSITPAILSNKDPKVIAKKADFQKTLSRTMQNELLEQYAGYLATKYPVTIHQDVVQSVIK
jgi:peptidyl-prolyl cis-trans isomerase D